MNKKKHISIRVDSDFLNKFYYVARYNGRSGSGQILYLMRSLIDDFEKEHGSNIKVTKVDIYKSTGIASRLGISAVPSVAFIQNGKLAGVLTGQITRQALEDGLIHM